jgi:hypothetical protein
MTQLSPNFSLHELTKSETALRLDIDNTPGEAETENLRLLCEKVLQPVRDHYGKGVKVNSGFRSHKPSHRRLKVLRPCQGPSSRYRDPRRGKRRACPMDHG